MAQNLFDHLVAIQLLFASNDSPISLSGWVPEQIARCTTSVQRCHCSNAFLDSTFSCVRKKCKRLLLLENSLRRLFKTISRGTACRASPLLWRYIFPNSCLCESSAVVEGLQVQRSVSRLVLAQMNACDRCKWVICAYKCSSWWQLPQVKMVLFH